jgi:hypothetical protein
MVRLLASLTYGLISFVIILISIYQQMSNIRNQHEFDVKSWLSQNNIEWNLNFMQKYGIYYSFIIHLLFIYYKNIMFC